MFIGQNPILYGDSLWICNEHKIREEENHNNLEIRKYKELNKEMKVHGSLFKKIRKVRRILVSSIQR